MDEEKVPRKSTGCFGRDLVGWLQLALFYVALYAFLTAFFGSMLTVLLQTIPKEAPRYYGLSSLLLDNPGMAVRPKTDIFHSLIAIDTADTTSWIALKEQIEYLVMNLGQDSANLPTQCDSDLPIVDCYAYIKWMLQTNLNCGSNYGYDTGEPCLILKFNKIYGYVAEPYDTIDEIAKSAAPHERYWTAWKANHVGVVCYGLDALHSELIESMEMYPPGFNKVVIDNALKGNKLATGNTVYIPPMIGLKIKLKKKYTLAQIECKLLANNIFNDGNENTRHGVVRFEVMVQSVPERN